MSWLLPSLLYSTDAKRTRIAIVMTLEPNTLLGKAWSWSEIPRFPRKRWFRKKVALGRKTNFFLGKTRKTIILDFGRIVSEKMFLFVFFGFP